MYPFDSNAFPPACSTGSGEKGGSCSRPRSPGLTAEKTLREYLDTAPHQLRREGILLCNDPNVSIKEETAADFAITSLQRPIDFDTVVFCGRWDQMFRHHSKEMTIGNLGSGSTHNKSIKRTPVVIVDGHARIPTKKEMAERYVTGLILF